MQKFLQKISSKLTAVKVLLLAVGVMCSQGVWAEAGDVTTNAEINFDSPTEIVTSSTTPKYSISGAVGTMTWDNQWTVAPWIEYGYLRFGNFTGTVALENNNIRSKDIVTISFELGFGKYSNKQVDFSFLDTNGTSILTQVFDAYNGDFNDSNPLNLDWSKMYRGSNEPIYDRRVYFTITINYETNSISTKTKCYMSGVDKAATEGTFSATLPSTTPIGYFTIYGNLSDKNNSARCSIFDNLKITTTEGDYSAATANYTIKWKDGETEIKSVTRSGDVDSSISLTTGDLANFTEGGTLFVYDNNDVEGKTVAGDGSTVITINVHEAATWNYTVNAVYGDENTLIKELENGTITESLSKSIAYPLYLNVGGKLYSKAANGSTYKVDITPTANNQTINFVYTPTNITDIVYCSEGEWIVNATATSAGSNMSSRSSNAQCGYATEDITLTSLEAGLYKVSLVVYSNSSAGATINFELGDNSYNASVSGASNWTSFNKEFALLSSGNVKWLQSGDSKNGVDFIYIQKLASPVIDAMVDCETYETSAAFKTYIEDLYNNGSLTTSDEVYAAHTAWQIALAKANGSTDLTKVIRNAAVSDAEATDWNDASAISISQEYSGAPDGYFIDIYQNTINTNQWVYGVPAGEYTIKAATRAAENVYGKLYVYSQAVGSDIASQDIIAAGNSGQTLGNGWNWTEMTFTVDATTNLLIGFYADASASDKWAGCDDWHMSIAGESVPVTAAGYATFSSAYALDLENIDGGKAYIAEVQENGGTITMTEWTSAVPANTGLLIKANTAPAAGETATVTIPVATDGTAPTTNYLKATDGNDVAAGNYVFAYMTSDYSGAGFYKLDNATHIDAGKAYLDGTAVTSAGGAIKFRFDEDTATAISTVAEDAAKFDGATYNLAGQRVDASYKGIVIRNGKKFLVK